MDKKTIAIVVALGLLVVFWFPVLQFLGLYKPQPAPQQSQQTEQTSPATPAQNTQQTNVTPTQSDSAVSLATLVQPVDSTVPAEPVKADTIVVTTQKFTVTLTTQGGGPIGLQLNEQFYRDGRPIQMLSQPAQVTPDVRFANNTFASSSLNYTCNQPAGRYDATNQPLILSFTYQNPQGGSITKNYIFKPDEYDYQFTLTVDQPATFGFERQYYLNWGTPLACTEPQLKTDYEAMEAVAMMGGSRINLNSYDDNGKLNESHDGQTAWAGVREKYYTAVLIPLGRTADGVLAQGMTRKVTTADGSHEERAHTISLNMTVASLQTVTDSFTVFVGPMDYFMMSKYGVDLEAMFDIGTTPVIGWIIKPFALAIMWLLPLLYKVVPNYGIVIILFALIIKLLTLPLSLKSMRSMNAMRDLAPKMEEMRKRHKNDPQQLNAAMMKMYKEHGVNPLSGCLPIILQMPLFFAMFSVFRSTILLRNAPFVGFINDLSRGASGFLDPYIILVLLMIGAQFLSQWLTMSKGGGAQTQQNKIFMYVMPPLMGFLFYSFAAGLVLYWTAFSLFSLIDYYIVQRGSKNEHIKVA